MKHRDSEAREDKRVRESNVTLGLTWETIFEIRTSLRSIQSMLENAVAAIDDPFRVVIQNIREGWCFRDKGIVVPGSHPCELVNETGNDLGIWFHTSAERMEGPEREVLDRNGDPRSQPIVIESGESVSVRFEGTGLEAVWVSVAYLNGTEFVAVNAAHRNGADMGINNP